MELQSLELYKRRSSIWWWHHLQHPNSNIAQTEQTIYQRDFHLTLDVSKYDDCVRTQSFRKKFTMQHSILTKSSKIRPGLVDLLVIPELKIPKEHKILYQVWRMCDASCTISKRCTQTLTSEWGNPVRNFQLLGSWCKSQATKAMHFTSNNQ